MAKKNINIGVNPGDGTGDVVREAFSKSKDNFDELYARPVADMNKSQYDVNNSGVVDSAEKVSGIDAAGNLSYYGKNAAGAIGFYTFPVDKVDLFDSQIAGFEGVIYIDLVYFILYLWDNVNNVYSAVAGGVSQGYVDDGLALKEPLNVPPIANLKVKVYNSDNSVTYEDYGGGGASLLTKTKTYTSGAQTITADFDIVQVSSLVVGNSFLQEGTQYTVSGAVVTITDTLTSGAVIQLKYWKAKAVNSTNYTKAESDAQFAKSIEISQEGWQILKDAGTLENAFYFTT